MRFVIAAAAAALALAACGQSGAPGQSANPLEAAFPNLFQTAYRAEGVFNNGEGQTGQVALIRSGRNHRMEFANNGENMAIVTNAEAQEAYVITSMGGRQVVMRMPLTAEQVQDPFEDWTDGTNATQVGPCAVAGEVGVEWSLPAQEGAAGPETACVTTDGIILKATQNGQTTWEMTSVQRGPQSPALFTVPEGAQVMDMGAMAGAMQNAIAAQKAQ